MRTALTIRRYLTVLTAAVFSRSPKDNARESYRARQVGHVFIVLAGSGVNPLSTFV
jgi:hypothetical protein